MSSQSGTERRTVQEQKQTQPALTSGQTVLMPESEQHVAHSGIYLKPGDFIHLVDCLFDRPYRSTMLTSRPVIAGMTHGDKWKRKGKIIFCLYSKW